MIGFRRARAYSSYTLYHADAGYIDIDGVGVVESSRYAYRNLFPMILTDLHLFEKIYGLIQID